MAPECFVYEIIRSSCKKKKNKKKRKYEEQWEKETNCLLLGLDI